MSTALSETAAATGYPSPALYIDGEWTAGSGDRTEPVINPATGEVLGHVPLATAADLDRALAAAARGWRVWRDTPVLRRTAILHRAADLMRERAAEIGRAMTLEQGKPLTESTGEAGRAAALLDWDTEEGRRAYGRIIPTGPGESLRVVREGIGPVAAFTPWNFPAGGPNRKIAAALAAGCSIVLKASEEVPATAVLLARCYQDAGLPAGVLNLVFGVPAEVSEHLIASPTIRFVAFTGSVPVGKLLAARAGSFMKPAIMELGGHAPVIVCDDVDPVAAAQACVRAKFTNAGQVCTSPSRFFVHESQHDAFVQAFVTATEAVVVGNGLEPGVQMGPLANARRREAVDRLVSESGAQVLTGGHALDRPGFFYAPTVLIDVPPDAALLTEEPFGPVAPILPYTDLDEVMDRANSLPYGLAAYGFTHRADRAEWLIDRFEAGILSINHAGGSVPIAPSGGFKESGYGREGGSEGLDGYLITKRVSHKLVL
ncbi:NAD-dependent succinate-semialdehyde dehydrogenase [Cryptosporangium aurantiacum]|uniref:Succinate-semialdehyde dehydrogenase / glutarate-semialdehyde dehydrogenase n=1 Tax=Cryptosporangium aurantiacum TaxID=134849 RepID=A0A1M7TW44_9ACTN|nr:NAD-dependent succinate-semialdehyde dehydrogenase [Cryptosporangium aurantiacum]SHN74964.1 succinate-semialdehyde dehydrogenase / glutarate-semialdehyde dehydrogenase [Cryptosporangium aurantiacum]